ncbi:MAG: STAS domain-containing protein [Oscillospiraceae bacterium]|nr:STAS domain-containing protein [Oscillospiraceae bacterium]
MKVYSAYDAGRLTVYLQGELDHHEASGTAAAVERLLDEYLPRQCVLDLGGLSFMDSSGIALILRLSRRMRGCGGTAWVENAAPQPARVIDASGLQRLLRTTLASEA